MGRKVMLLVLVAMLSMFAVHNIKRKLIFLHHLTSSMKLDFEPYFEPH